MVSVMMLWRASGRSHEEGVTVFHLLFRMACITAIYYQ
ncbi:hypothetical protein SXCC_01827 [Gluconacetobacter sp. SXCC-1]|nr:hypothetical protein SXCC_01827 [Gluconacetobacter sp. SXCC-1]